MLYYKENRSSTVGMVTVLPGLSSATLVEFIDVSVLPSSKLGRDLLLCFKKKVPMN